jgi:hypothetical protein
MPPGVPNSPPTLTLYVYLSLFPPGPRGRLFCSSASCGYEKLRAYHGHGGPVGLAAPPYHRRRPAI